MKVFEHLPPASPRIGFFKTVAGWKDAALVEFGPEGTMHYAQGAIKGETGNLYTTGMKERQIIFGDTDILESAIRDIDKSVQPGLLFVTSSPVSEIIGTDLDMITLGMQDEIRAHLSVWDRVPVEGRESQGEAAAYRRAAAYLEKTGWTEKKSGFVVLGLTEADWNGSADLEEICRMAERYFGVECLNDRDGRYCLKDLQRAQWILVISPEAEMLARKAHALWGTPWHMGVPYGVDACSRMISSMEAAFGCPAVKDWQIERREAVGVTLQMREKLKSLPGFRVFLDARQGRSDAWKAFLSEELGMDVVCPCRGTSALSTDGGIEYMGQVQNRDILLASGLMCRMHHTNPSICIEYPAADQLLLSRHIPMMGIRGVENVAYLLFNNIGILTEGIV